MKKFTFLAALALATSMSTYSQDVISGSTEWSDELTTVSSADEFVRTAPIAIDADANTIVAGRYSLQENLQFGLYTFTGITANDAFIGKYNKAGMKQWVAGVNGNAVFTAIATDAEGNIYAAGKFAAEANVLGTDGNYKTITDGDATNTTRSSAFLAKYSKDGVVLDVKAYTATIDESKMPDWCWNMAEANVTINQIQVDGSNVYLSITHRGTVKVGEETLGGSYYIYSDLGGAFMDLSTVDIVYLETANLESSAWVATLSSSQQVVSDVQYQPESVCFTVEDGVVYAGFTGVGNLKLEAYETETTCNFDYSSEGIEHGFIFARIKNDGTVTTKVYETTPTTSSNSLNSVDCMKIVDGKLCVAGTYNVEGLFGGLEFKGGCDTYVSILDANSLDLVSARTSGYDEGDANHYAEVVTGMFSANGSIFVAGYSEKTSDHSFDKPTEYQVDLTSGEMSEVENEYYILSIAQSGGYVARVEAEGYSYDIDFCDEKTAGIKDVEGSNMSIVRNGDIITVSEPANISVYSVDGVQVASVKASTSISLAGLSKGVYIVKAGKKTVKIKK